MKFVEIKDFLQFEIILFCFYFVFQSVVVFRAVLFEFIYFSNCEPFAYFQETMKSLEIVNKSKIPVRNRSEPMWTKSLIAPNQRDSNICPHVLELEKYRWAIKFTITISNRNESVSGNVPNPIARLK